MRTYPAITDNRPETIKGVLEFIIRERQNDVNDRNNFPNLFMSGRKVGKVPSGSTDAAVTDRLGDFNYDGNYLYIFAQSTVATVWRRATLGAW